MSLTKEEREEGEEEERRERKERKEKKSGEVSIKVWSKKTNWGSWRKEKESITEKVGEKATIKKKGKGNI